ncbi:MAG: hypothetical protein K9L22_11500 [Methylococcaceae bacterium]|nr:hypothetical protein [Methylococcaceae bacterium]
MKLKKLNKALVAAGLVAGAAISMPSQAVVMSDDGTGEVLIYPFYTVQGPESAPRTTLFTITNTMNEYKAVKVRFHEAHNSRDALDFNLYLSPNDVWTGAVSRGADGVAQLSTSDTSCTIPSQIMSQTNSFSTLAFTQAGNNDGGNQDALRTNEGYIEVIEMGVIDQAEFILTAGTAPIAAYATINTLGEAIKHINNIPGGVMDAASGIPAGCAALQHTALTGGTWAIGANGGSLDTTHVGVSQPTGGLTGSAMIVQASAGTVAAYNATALKHFYDVDASLTGTCLDDATATGVGANGYACETNGLVADVITTARAFDDLHSFKDLDPSTANARSIQTYPNLAMSYPQVSDIFDADALASATATWAENELVSTGVTNDKTNVLFAAVNDVDAAVAATNCGGFNGVASTAVADKICANARPVSAVLAKSSIINEYVLESDAAAGIDFRTDVVVTFPTKWYFSDNGRFDAATGKVLNDSGVVVPDATLDGYKLAPFSAQFVSSTASGKRDRACERFSINDADTMGANHGQLFNREEAKPNVTSSGLVPSPAINVDASKNYICHESNVLTLNDGDLLTSRIANGLEATVANSATGTNSFNIDFPTAFKSGWFEMAFDTAGTATITPVVGAPVPGLPAVGFVVEGLVSGAQGFEGNFTAALPHQSK